MMRAQLSGAIELDQITPELAATVVKHYLLPMFESDNQKFLKKKYKKMRSPRDGSNTTRGEKGLIKQSALEDILKGKKPPKTIYEELKLSEKLIDELHQMKDDYNFLKS